MIAWPTISWHKLVRGSDQLYAVRWYFCEPGALQIDRDSFVNLERLWDSDYFAVGKFDKTSCEPRGLQRDICPLQPFPGTGVPIGEPEWFRSGVPAELLAAKCPESCADDCLGERRRTGDL